MARKKIILSLLAAGIAALSCADKKPLRQPTPYPAPKIDVISSGSVSSFEELIEKPYLSREEFGELIENTNSLSDLESLLRERRLIYPKKGTEDIAFALNLNYGAPWPTHNRGYGVCDELAVYVLPFLLKIPEVRNVNLVHIVGTVMVEEASRAVTGQMNIKRYLKPNASHALVIFQDSSSSWRYSNNCWISNDQFASPKQTIDAAAAMTQFLLDPPLTYWMREIKSPGSWIYDNKESAKLQPTVEIQPD